MVLPLLAVQLQQEHRLPGGKQQQFSSWVRQPGRALQLLGRWRAEARSSAQVVQKKREKRAKPSCPKFILVRYRLLPLPSLYLCQQVRNIPVIRFCLSWSFSFFGQLVIGNISSLAIFSCVVLCAGCRASWMPLRREGSSRGNKGGVCQSLEQVVRTTWCGYFIRAAATVNTNILLRV